MPRAIVYASDPARVRTADVDGGDNDAYLSKLTKYVPAEVLAFFVPTYANLPANAERWHWTVFGIGLATLFRFWAYRRFVFAGELEADATSADTDAAARP